MLFVLDVVSRFSSLRLNKREILAFVGSRRLVEDVRHSFNVWSLCQTVRTNFVSDTNDRRTIQTTTQLRKDWSIGSQATPDRFFKLRETMFCIFVIAAISNALVRVELPE